MSRHQPYQFSLVGVPNLVFAERRELHNGALVEVGVCTYPDALCEFSYWDHRDELNREAYAQYSPKVCRYDEDRRVYVHRVAFPATTLTFGRLLHKTTRQSHWRVRYVKLVAGVSLDEFYKEGMQSQCETLLLPNIDEDGNVCTGFSYGREYVPFNVFVTRLLDHWRYTPFTSDFGLLSDLYFNDYERTFAEWAEESSKSLKRGLNYFHKACSNGAARDTFSVGEARDRLITNMNDYLLNTDDVER